MRYSKRRLDSSANERCREEVIADQVNESVDFIGGVDYIVFYISALQRNWSMAAWDYYKTKEPEMAIELNGIDYCYIYKTSKQ